MILRLGEVIKRSMSSLNLSKVKFALIDLSGTLHVEDIPTEGAIDALARLRKSGIKVLFVTNTTKESKRVLHERLTTMGFQIQKEEIFTSLTAANSLVVEQGFRPFFLVDDKAMEDFSRVQTDNPNSVVVGLAPQKFTYENMNIAFRILLEGGKLIAIHKGKYYKTSDGLSLGPGPFVAALEFASSKTPLVVGKPNKAFFESALETIGCNDTAEAVMIGDDWNDDVNGGLNAGISSLLVKTGKYRENDEQKIDNPINARVFPNFRVAVDEILRHRRH